MPLCKLFTNVSEDLIPDGINEGLTRLITEKLGVDQKIVTVHVVSEKRLSRGGTFEPNGYMELINAGGFGSVKAKRELSKAILEFTRKQLNITDSSNLFIFFKIPSAVDLGIGDSLVSDLE